MIKIKHEIVVRWLCSLALLYGVLLQAGLATALTLLLVLCAFELLYFVVHVQGKRIAALELRVESLMLIARSETVAKGSVGMKHEVSQT